MSYHLLSGAQTQAAAPQGHMATERQTLDSKPGSLTLALPDLGTVSRAQTAGLGRRG